MQHGLGAVQGLARTQEAAELERGEATELAWVMGSRVSGTCEGRRRNLGLREYGGGTSEAAEEVGDEKSMAEAARSGGSRPDLTRNGSGGGLRVEHGCPWHRSL